MNILEVLKNKKILVSDGAMGTMLLQKGLTAGQCPEQFNVTHPEVIQSIHRDYFNAGADIVTTNSFGGTAARLKMHGLSAKVAEFSQSAVKNARLVCPEGKFVAGSIGPSGLVLEPLGEASRSDVTKMFEEQARALADAGADIIFIETMMALEELECAMQAVKNVTSLPVSACMTFEKGPAGIRTQWGVDIKSFVSLAEQNGADIIGSNCGRGFDEMVEVINEMRPLSKLPLIAQANAGLPKTVDGKQVYSQTPEMIVPFVKKMIDIGVNIIGGCCGTGPEHISEIRKMVDNS